MNGKLLSINPVVVTEVANSLLSSSTYVAITVPDLITSVTSLSSVTSDAPNENAKLDITF